MAGDPDTNSLFPISTVSALTGVNAVTLRAWERRYSLINPARTEAGHRLYTRTDIEHIKTILQLLDEGMSISRVSSALNHTAVDSPATSQTDDPWQHYATSLLQAVITFDEELLEETYNEAMSIYPVELVTRYLLMPLLNTLGERWVNKSTGIAEEHFFSIFMRNKLGARFHHRNLHNTGPRLVTACLPGEQHEFGLLVFALSAHSRGYRIVLLGSNMPLAQLPDVVHRTKSHAVVLSGSNETVQDNIDDDLRTLQRHSKVPVCIGGSYAVTHETNLQSLGLYPLGSDLGTGLNALEQLLSHAVAS